VNKFVAFIPVKEPPKLRCLKPVDGRYIVAWTPGPGPWFDPGPPEWYQVSSRKADMYYDLAGNVYIRAYKGCKLTHLRNGVGLLSPGLYQVVLSAISARILKGMSRVEKPKIEKPKEMKDESTE